MSDITRQKTIDYLYYLKTHYPKNLIIPEYIDFAISSLETDEAYQLEYESTTKDDLGVDCIPRQAVQTRLKEIINEMETIFADIREREVNDSVCGLCEYDCDHGLDGFANECPGFEKNDCFKLKEKYRAEWLDISNLYSVTPQEPILDKIYADIQRLRGCSCSCSDGIIDDVENILDKYKGESEG